MATLNSCDRNSIGRRIIAFFVLAVFLLNSGIAPFQCAYAQEVLQLPQPGKLVPLSPVFTPAYLKGMVIDPQHPFKFDFIIYRGDDLFSVNQKRTEYAKLVKYFLAALAVPDTDQWVNLSPYEQDRIIPDVFGKTEMGRDLLAQDYILKQIGASLTSPDTELGKKFWSRIYETAYEKFGVTEIPTDIFNKVWIVPDKAVIYEKGNTVYVLEHHLKVMMDADYLAMKNNGMTAMIDDKTGISKISGLIMREIIIPSIEKEVNEDKNFAQLRQIYSGMLLAAWYKRTLKESILAKVYGDQSKVKGIDQDPKSIREIYDRYVVAFKAGVFNIIKEDVDTYTREVVPRKYFSGGAVSAGREFDVPGYLQRVEKITPQGIEDAAQADLVSVQMRGVPKIGFINNIRPDAAMIVKPEDIFKDEESFLKINQIAKQAGGGIELISAGQGPLVFAHLQNQYYPSLLRALKTGQLVIVLDAHPQDDQIFSVEQNVVAPQKRLSDAKPMGIPGNLDAEYLFIDHHFEASFSDGSSFREMSTTPLVIKYMLQLIKGDKKADLERISHAVLFADHSDADIVLSGLVVRYLYSYWQKTPESLDVIVQLLEDAAIFNDHRFLTGDQARDKNARRLVHLIEALDKQKIGYGNILDKARYFLEAVVSGEVVNEEVERVIAGYDQEIIRSVGKLKTEFDRPSGGVKFDKKTGVLIVNIGADVSGEKVLEFIDSLDDRLGRKDISVVLIATPGNQNKTRYKFMVIPDAHPERQLSEAFYSAFNGKFANYIMDGTSFGGREDSGGSPKIGIAFNDVEAVADYLKSDSILELTKIDRKVTQEGDLRGGIDFSQSNLDMQIKRDGSGVPLPISRQNLENIRIDGIIPEILDIRPAVNSPLFD
jgi:hypothetical protein